MIGGIAAKALILAVGLGAGLGAGEIGSMYNYDETVSIYKENKWFDKMALGSISQGDGKGIEVGKHKLHLGGWEDNKRIGGNAKGGGKVGENDVDIIFTQNRFKKSDNGNNGSSGNNFGRTTKGVSNRHVCILLGKNLVSSGLQQTSSESNHQQISGNNGDVCWNYSWWVSKQKANGGGWYDIAATGGNQSRVFLDSTLDPRLGIIELNPTNGGIKGALGRKGWVLGLKVDNPKKWCHVYHDKSKDQWRGNSIDGIEKNRKNRENMRKVGFDFLRQSVMVWYEKDGTITSGWKDNNNGSHDSQNSGSRKFMEVINCYQV